MRVCLLNYRKNGTAFLNQFNLSPLRDSAGNLVSFDVCVCVFFARSKNIKCDIVSFNAALKPNLISPLGDTKGNVFYTKLLILLNGKNVPENDHHNHDHLNWRSTLPEICPSTVIIRLKFVTGVERTGNPAPGFNQSGKCSLWLLTRMHTVDPIFRYTSSTAATHNALPLWTQREMILIQIA